MIGRGGDDITNGKQGSDTYNYADEWGQDTLLDPAGTDTVDFSAVSGTVNGALCPELEDILGGVAEDYEGNSVGFTSRVENFRGGAGDNRVFGCTGRNVLSSGGGQDNLLDVGGYGQEGTDIPPSSDVYTGFVGTSQASVLDTGGKDDLLNLANRGSKSVTMERVDFDADGSAGSLFVSFGETGERGVLIINQFESTDYSATFNGRIEGIRFKDKTVSPKASSIPVQETPLPDAMSAADLPGGSLLP